MKKRNNLIFGMAFLILLSSCSPQNFVYWKNIQSEAKCLENERYEAIIQKDDSDRGWNSFRFFGRNGNG